MTPIFKNADNKENSSSTLHSSSQLGARRWYSTPNFIRRVFDEFPLSVYPTNPLPCRTFRDRAQHVLYVFKTSGDTGAREASFNPGCLKWQTYLHISGIDFITLRSNNHASPTGALPFLIPASPMQKNLSESPVPIPANKMQRWVQELQESPHGASNTRYDAYMALLDHRVRCAWLYTLYLEPENFDSIARRFYVAHTSSSVFVRATVASQLRSAAEKELLKYSAVIDAESLYSQAAKAFEALSILLGNRDSFFEADGWSLLDASVFAYTHLLLDEKLGWKLNRMTESLKGFDNLVRHQERIFTSYYIR